VSGSAMLAAHGDEYVDADDDHGLLFFVLRAVLFLFLFCGD
jgi:hypothetical protein